MKKFRWISWLLAFVFLLECCPISVYAGENNLTDGNISVSEIQNTIEETDISDNNMEETIDSPEEEDFEEKLTESESEKKPEITTEELEKDLPVEETQDEEFQEETNDIEDNEVLFDELETIPCISEEVLEDADANEEEECAKGIIGTNCSSTYFKDLNLSEWYHLDVDYVVSNGLMVGTGEDAFGKDIATTRAMVVTILYRMSDETVNSEEIAQCSFVDIPKEEWYTEAVAWAASRKIVSGISKTEFAPNDEITREQMVAMLRRYANYCGYNIEQRTELNGFSDATSVSTWALEDMKWARAIRLISGSEESGTLYLKPQGKTSRVEAAAFIHRFSQYKEPAPISIEECGVQKNGDDYSLYFEVKGAYKKAIDNKYYIVQFESYGEEVSEDFEPVAFSKADFFSTEKIEVKGSKQDLKNWIMGSYAIAIFDDNREYKILTDYIPVSNPEKMASNIDPIFKGTSKKGLQGIYYASYEKGSDIVDARNANTKQTLINLDLASVVSTTSKTGYVAYSYKGKIYYFSELDDLKNNIRSLNYGYKQYLYGNSGTTPVAVTLCLLLSYNSETSFLIDPAARTSGHTYYMLNVREAYARETLEALFIYLGEIFGQSDCYVSNWILGNEINSSKAWNYTGNLSFDTYMECYATTFRLLYNGVKSEKSGNTVCISLDNGWTAAPDTYAGKITLDTFASKIFEQNPNIDWSIAYHAYSYPLTRADFWNDYQKTTDSLSTPYISMRNISVLTNYASTIEETYGKLTGSIRVLLTEQGYSYGTGAELQATAIARGYYIAQFNDRIDAFIIRAVIDDSDETSGKLYFGLMNAKAEKRIAFYVYEYMDSDLEMFKNTPAEGTVSSGNYSKFNKAKEIVCDTDWESIVWGFDLSKLAEIK